MSDFHNRQSDWFRQAVDLARLTFAPSEALMNRDYEHALARGDVPPLPLPQMTGEEWTPAPCLSRRVWTVTSWTPDGTQRGPAWGKVAAYLPAEALQAIVQQARSDGLPVTQLRWTVTEDTP